MDREKINEIGSLMRECFGLSVACLGPEGDVRYETDGRSNPLYRMPSSEWLQRLVRNHPPANVPLLHQTDYFECYLEIGLGGEGEPGGRLMAGPVLFAAVRVDMLEGLMGDAGIRDKSRVLEYYEELPVMSRSRFLGLGTLLHYMLHGEKIGADDIAASDSGRDRPEIGREIDLNVSNRLYTFTYHHDTRLEKRFYQLIREGRPEEAMEARGEFDRVEGIGLLAKKSRIRHEKNLGIVVIVLATRAAMDGGLHPEVAYTMSDLYIQRIEELSTADEIRKISNEAAFEFASRVRDNRQNQLSRAVSSCIQYIFKHLYEPVSLQDLCEHAKLNASYLSRRFKRETGLSPVEYIQQCKVEEAKKLLSLTTLSITEICTRLNFNDQSYFTKVFKRRTGRTPGQYRNDGR